MKEASAERALRSLIKGIVCVPGGGFAIEYYTAREWLYHRLQAPPDPQARTVGHSRGAGAARGELGGD